MCIILQLCIAFVNTFFINIYIFVKLHLISAYLCTILCILFIFRCIYVFINRYKKNTNTLLFIILSKLFREFLSKFWDFLLIFLVKYVKLILYCRVFLCVFPYIALYNATITIYCYVFPTIFVVFVVYL